MFCHCVFISLTSISRVSKFSRRLKILTQRLIHSGKPKGISRNCYCARAFSVCVHVRCACFFFLSSFFCACLCVRRSSACCSMCSISLGFLFETVLSQFSAVQSLMWLVSHGVVSMHICTHAHVVVRAHAQRHMCSDACVRVDTHTHTPFTRLAFF